MTKNALVLLLFLYAVTPSPDLAMNQGMIATGNHIDFGFAARSTTLGHPLPGEGMPLRGWSSQ